jgi:two-component system sensor histidine kinase UhpB
MEQLGYSDTAMVEVVEELVRVETSLAEQRLGAHVLEQQDEERRWIASQLHEVTAQNFSAIAISLEILRQSRSLPSDVEFLLAKCYTLCEQSLEQVLTLSRQLHPPLLDLLGLTACLRRYIEDFTKRSGIHVEFRTEPWIERLALEMETHLFRVAQEGLTNIFRHSGSRNAIVRLERQQDQVILQIEDFGRGMPATATQAVCVGEVGLGIRAMHERLRRIGGRLELRSSNQGTMLTARVQL